MYSCTAYVVFTLITRGQFHVQYKVAGKSNTEDRRYRFILFTANLSYFRSVGTVILDRLCGLVVRVPGYRSRGPGSIPGTTKFSEK
jgi:hypothetical protein